MMRTVVIRYLGWQIQARSVGLSSFPCQGSLWSMPSSPQQHLHASIAKVLQGWWKCPWRDEFAPLEIGPLEGAMPGAHLQFFPKSLLPLSTGAVLYVSTLSASPLRYSADDLSSDITKKTKDIWYKVDLNALIQKAFLYEQNAILHISDIELMPLISY